MFQGKKAQYLVGNTPELTDMPVEKKRQVPLAQVPLNEKKQVLERIRQAEEASKNGGFAGMQLSFDLRDNYGFPDDVLHAPDVFAYFRENAGVSEEKTRHQREGDELRGERKDYFENFLEVRKTLLGLNEKDGPAREKALDFLVEASHQLCSSQGTPCSVTREHFAKAAYISCSGERLEELRDTFGICRPGIVAFQHDRDLEAFKKALGHESGGGFVFSKSLFPESSPLSKVDLSFSRANEMEMYHEERHRIDPLADKRTGIDCAVAELFAYYGNAKHGDIDWEPSGPKDTRVTFRNCAKRYYDSYAGLYRKGQAPSREEYEAKIDDAVDAIKIIHEKMPPKVAEHTIANSRTLDDLIKWKTEKLLQDELDGQLKKVS